MPFAGICLEIDDFPNVKVTSCDVPGSVPNPTDSDALKYTLVSFSELK